MHTRFSIICFVFACFALFSANTATACGSEKTSHGKADTEKSCCKTVKRSSAEKQHCSGNDGCAERHPGRGCPDTDGCGGCHCPCGVVTLPVPGGALMNENPLFPTLPPVHEDMLRQEFYFAQHLPQEVYLPIWQPPQLPG